MFFKYKQIKGDNSHTILILVTAVKTFTTITTKCLDTSLGFLNMNRYNLYTR